MCRVGCLILVFISRRETTFDNEGGNRIIGRMRIRGGKIFSDGVFLLCLDDKRISGLNTTGSF